MTVPTYPVYIVSKGRYDSMLTSRSLNKMRVPHYIVIEPQEVQKYKRALNEFSLEQASLIVLPIGDHGNGPGLARNFAWDHSISFGYKKHWVLDDNITDFYRLNRNKRIRVGSGIFFKVMEEFVDRYTNIKIAGPAYRFFCPSNEARQPYTPNTRIYSCLLIDNDCKHRWRGRYNEDTDICLRVLKDGDCTVQFNIFLQGKAGTQQVKGGNTDEFYHREIGLDDETGEAILADDLVEVDKEAGNYNAVGTLAKSQMLVDMHPDVTRLVLKYGRWHHYVDYRRFAVNLFQFKEGVPENLKDEINEYGMKLIKLDKKITSK